MNREQKPLDPANAAAVTAAAKRALIDAAQRVRILGDALRSGDAVLVPMLDLDAGRVHVMLSSMRKQAGTDLTVAVPFASMILDTSDLRRFVVIGMDGVIDGQFSHEVSASNFDELKRGTTPDDRGDAFGKVDL